MTRRTFDNRVMPDVDLRSPLRRLSARGGPLGAASRAGGREHPAVVTAAPDLLGVAVVVIRGREARASTVGVSTRGVAVGDRVMVAKQGGRWVITTTQTPHAPTPVDEADGGIIGGTHNGTGSWYGNVQNRIIALDQTVNTLLARLDAEQITRRPE